MKDFAILLDALSNTPARNGKLTLLRNYFLASPDPDRGFALAALTDEMPVTIPLRRVLTDLTAGGSYQEETGFFTVESEI